MRGVDGYLIGAGLMVAAALVEIAIGEARAHAQPCANRADWVKAKAAPGAGTRSARLEAV